MKFAASLALVAAASALCAPAFAQFAKVEDAAKYRQSTMFIMNTHMGRLGAMANGRAPYDPKVAVEHAELIATLSHLPWPAYVPNSGADKLPQTRAKAEIWAEPAKFKETNEKLMSETGKLLAAAKTNNLDNLKKAFGDTAATCKSCHDNFRKD